MQKPLVISTCISIAATVLIAGQSSTIVSRHANSQSAKFIMEETPVHLGAGSPVDVARAYLRENGNLFFAGGVDEDLQITQTTESLLGTHVVFQQMVQGIPVRDSQFIVSMTADKGVFRAYNTVMSLQGIQLKRDGAVQLRENDALDLAWNYLGVHGDLIAMPSARKQYVLQGDQLVLVYAAEIHTNLPLGNWRVDVDAITGKIIGAQDLSIYRNPVARSFSGEAIDRGQAERDLQSRLVTRQLSSGKRAEGSGQVFDPDPRTTLGDSSLRDTSPASAFEDAYMTRTLSEITNAGGVFRLEGPYCNITNFEAPSTSPSTSVDGTWTAKRGDNAFNDAMTYFHIDQSQRYMQSLGFTGSKGILETGISVDTDGVNGVDNSYFTVNNLGPALSFGHGCVDDNEDADVILHEYGHAIQWGINSNWSGGDAGAMGEGFGDYWAGSYSWSTPNGRSFFPEWVYSWDGHSSCWPGRFLNKTGIQYQSTQSYGAHQSIAGGVSDELWSTPLFMALVNLTDQGVPRSQVDQIVLEAHFGFGAGVRMPELAQATVQTARMLFPNGPHGDVFQESFARHGILDPVSEFSYISAHVPPAGDDPSAWISEIEIANPNDAPVQILAKVYGNDAAGVGSDTFGSISSQTINLDGGASTTFTPTGFGQRWVKFESARPITGTTIFRRTADILRGEERVAMPLFDAIQTGPEIIYPHVPANRAKFWSGAVLLNPSIENRTLTIELVGDQGSDLTSLLTGSSSITLKPFEKWVTFLAGGMFDDEASSEKVAFVRIHGDGDLVGFQLYGLQDDQGAAATSGIMSTNDRPKWYAMRQSLVDINWAGFSILNPNPQQATITMSVFDTQGELQAQASSSLPARTKRLGLNTTNDGFVYPYGSGSALISLPAGSDVATTIIQSDQPLRIFELSGDDDDTILDGTAVSGGKSKVVFNSPSGQLQIINGDTSDKIDITSRDALGNALFAFSFDETLDPWSTYTVDVSDWNAATIEVRGSNMAAFLVDRDIVADSLSIIAPAQIMGLIQ